VDVAAGKCNDVTDLHLFKSHSPVHSSHATLPLEVIMVNRKKTSYRREECIDDFGHAELPSSGNCCPHCTHQGQLLAVLLLVANPHARI
jgi:hypothetical protein